MPLLLSGLRLVLGKVMGQHKVHRVHTRFKVGFYSFYPRDTRLYRTFLSTYHKIINISNHHDTSVTRHMHMHMQLFRLLIIRPTRDSHWTGLGLSTETV